MDSMYFALRFDTETLGELRRRVASHLEHPLDQTRLTLPNGWEWDCLLSIQGTVVCVCVCVCVSERERERERERESSA